jgi:hypothetical protein
MQLTSTFALLAIALPAVLAHPAALRRDDTPGSSASKDGNSYDHTFSSHKLDVAWAGSEGKKYEQSQAAYKSVNKCEGHTGDREKCDNWNENEASGEAHAASQSVAGELHESVQEDDFDWKVKGFEKEKEGEKKEGGGESSSVSRRQEDDISEVFSDTEGNTSLNPSNFIR